jgi:hypothetical protein
MPLWSCQTAPKPSQGIITATEDAIWRSAICASKPILISRQDVLTAETAEMIGDHNNVLFCECDHLRPAGFDPSICKS